MYVRPVFDPLTVIGNTCAELDVLTELCASNDAALRLKLDELHRRIDRQVADLDEHGKDDYLSNINDQYIMVSITMPMYQNYALFTLGFSFFEKCLNEVSAELRRDRGIALGLKDIRGQGIGRAKIFLSKVCGVTGAFETAAWSQAMLYSEIRNTIAHRCGFLDYRPDDAKSLYRRLLGLHGIELKQVWDVADQPDRQIGFGNAFVIDSIATYTHVLQALGESLRQGPEARG